MKKCEKCGAELDENARFCPECFTQISDVEQVKTAGRSKIKKAAIIIISAVLLMGIVSVIFFLTRRPGVVSPGDTTDSHQTTDDTVPLTEAKTELKQYPAYKTLDSLEANPDGLMISTKFASTGYWADSDYPGQPLIIIEGGEVAGTTGSWANTPSQGTWAQSSNLPDGATLVELTNLTEIREYIKSLGENAHIAKITVSATRAEKKHGYENAEGHLYVGANKVSDYSHFQFGTSIIPSNETFHKDISGWELGEEFVAEITEADILDGFSDGTYNSFIYYAGADPEDYVRISGFSVSVEIEYFTQTEEN